ncbi:MAG TPA: isoprenylcysteine carboxylmethyltransferase family protein [Gemmatimonadaceae bacterium]|nr:isoprenylcysteine carboxylmethyltransferase family protein [Gemmatimonadaceae bacterium]
MIAASARGTGRAAEREIRWADRVFGLKRSADAPDIVVLPPVLVGGTLIFGIIIHYAFWTTQLLPTVLARVLGLVVFVSAGVLAHLSQRAMQRVGTNVLPTRPTLALATDGPYRYTRNPLYIAAIGVYLGVTLWVDGWAPLVLLLPMVWVLNRGIILREEQYLTRKFGEAYLSYQSRVRRWL